MEDVFAEDIETMTESDVALLTPIAPTEAPKKRRRKKAEVPVAKDNHCPACKLGQDLSKGEGTHVLDTIEHPIRIEPVVPEKPVKSSPVRAMHKELRGAASFAEKMLPKKIAEKAKAVAEVTRLEAEIQELVRVIQALGGHTPVGMPAIPAQHVQPSVTMAAIMSDAPLPPNIATMPPVSRAGGGALDVALVPADELSEDAFLTEKSSITGGGGWV